MIPFGDRLRTESHRLPRCRMSASAFRALFALAVVAVLAPATRAQQPTKPAEPVLHIRLIDDSVVKLTLLEDRVEFLTPHGKLSIPVADIRQVELGMRVPEDVARQIEQAAADLGSNQFRKREEAMATLLKHRERSYAALKQAAKSPDAAVAKRVEELI